MYFIFFACASICTILTVLSGIFKVGKRVCGFMNFICFWNIYICIYRIIKKITRNIVFYSNVYVSLTTLWYSKHDMYHFHNLQSLPSQRLFHSRDYHLKKIIRQSQSYNLKLWYVSMWISSCCVLFKRCCVPFGPLAVSSARWSVS